jgi:pyruvate,water dikinase
MPISADLETSILQAAQALKAHLPHDFKLSVRSSATSEDSEASFAGQHATVLNVSEANLIEAYKDVVASTFSPRAIYYRRRRGYRDQDVNMSVACIVMIHAKVSGVMYTVDPNDSRHGVIMISAVWGLAADAVEGAAATDFYQVHKTTRALGSLRKWAEGAGSGRTRRTEPRKICPKRFETRGLPPREEIRLLADYAVRLENHYGYALDIEWAIDRRASLHPSRRPPKRSQRLVRDGGRTDAPPRLRQPAAADSPRRADGATARHQAMPTSFSPITPCIVTSPKVLWWSPARPRRVMPLGRSGPSSPTSAAVTGHMASVAREFRSLHSWEPATAPR